MTEKKADALRFLQNFQAVLADGRLPSGPAMDPEIRKIVALAKRDDRQKHLRLPEAAFLNTFVVPTLFEQLQIQGGLTAEQTGDALLNEYHHTMPDTSHGSPIYPLRHPFRKILGASPESIYRAWRNPPKGDGLTQSAPDFALRAPFPHSIVFEGKYFPAGSAANAAKQLTMDLYQAFFYRGLPRAEPKRKGRAAWDYDYACLLAFDASRDGTLLAAWNNLGPKVRKSFWDTANIYVMILGN